MRKLIVLLTSLVFFIACNNNKNSNNPDLTNREQDDYANSDTRDEVSENAGISGWSKTDKTKFMKECIESFEEGQEELANKICPCVLGKMEREYASYSEADTKGGEAAGERMALACNDEINANTGPARNNNATGVSQSNLVGNWGNLSGSKINYYDDATGNMIGAGLSSGGGYEFNMDGSYTQTFLATSSRPTYKIFVYTKGTYAVSGNQVTLNATDRHYRKWRYEDLETDEHSRPAAETHQWTVRSNQYTGKPCLYMLKSGESQEREYCKE